MFQFRPKEEYEFDSDVLIGWIVEGDWSPINFEFRDFYRLYFLTLDQIDTEYPVRGKEYTFGGLPFPAVHSVGVTIDEKRGMIIKGPSVLSMSPLYSNSIKSHRCYIHHHVFVTNYESQSLTLQFLPWLFDIYIKKKNFEDINFNLLQSLI